jgi:Xaa-Pro aminopeptidase
MSKEKLSAIRTLMNEYKIEAYIIPGTDPHQSEYLPELWKRREFISGFNGSAGELAITNDTAALWTDSRYFLQAEEQLRGSGIALQKIGLPETPGMGEWLLQNLSAGNKVGIDPRLVSYRQFQNLKKELAAEGVSLVSVNDNLVDMIWEDQPDYPKTPVKIHPPEFAGVSAKDKISSLREKLAGKRADALIISTLDAIAWLFNIRGNDVAYNPYIISYALITGGDAMFFVHPEQLNGETRKYLKDEGISVHPYCHFQEILSRPGEKDIRVMIDPGEINQWIIDQLPENAEIIPGGNPVIAAKAAKNESELNGFREAHIRDGVAMVRFLRWLEENLGKMEITEISASDKLESFRAGQKYFAGLSFETISAYGAHGAIVHYSSTPESDVPLKPEGIYLLDSGGQYLDGTTDITRTIALGPPTPEQKEMFTRVLKGHISLATAKFPEGTTGPALDTLARKALWDVLLNYGHGTGHGVGAYLGVHEGPQGISYYRGQGVALKEGMVNSNEPGFYKEGEYGIRIENLIITRRNKENNSFLEFETITLCPIDTSLIDTALLTAGEKEWLNSYHREVYQKLSAFLGEEDRNWLKRKTAPIS